ncbi:MAG: hypothetical protein ACRDNK_02530 [Solirubrobacteraceae bacterium]
MSTEDAAGEAATCTPCRGTGRLVSGLGGEPHEVSCPWCQGTGERIPGIDAQELPAEAGAPVHPADAGDQASGEDAPPADPPA